jgi:hypothetical protein
MLPPTSPRLREPNTQPYFMWDMPMTVAQMHEALASSDAAVRDEIIVRLLREANSRDVFLFINWNDIDEAWSRVSHRLGRSRPVWELVLRHHHQHDLAATG